MSQAPTRQPSGRGRRRLIVALVAPALAAGGCSAAGSVSGSATPVSGRPAATSAASAPAKPARRNPARPGFTVRGSVPVLPNASQDTRAQTAGGPCQPRQHRRDQALGQATVAGFTSTGMTASAALLAHFLGGTGKPVRFGPRSPISRQARASSAFRSLNRAVQAAVLSQLRAGRTRVRLAETSLPEIRFGLPGSSQDLYLGFRGTQGLDVRGTGTITRGRYTGRMTYVIRDSYGFPPRDQLLGVGTAMRYLQVNCGNPPYRGGAHWFPDSLMVTEPFRH